MPDPRRAPRAIRRACWALLLAGLLLAGCSSAFSRALERGDALARAGDWDNAAAAYETAVALDPGDAEARARLRVARQHQSERLLEQARTALARDDHAAALQMLQLAVQLSPDSERAQAALAAANDASVERARRLLAAGDAQRALSLAQLVLRGAPGHGGASAVQGEAREALARDAYARAEAHLVAKRLGNALLELAYASQVRPGYRDAAARAARVRADIEADVRFYAVLERGQSTEQRDLAAAVEAELAETLAGPSRPLLAVVERGAPAGAAGLHFGVRLQAYDLAREERSTQRGCTYVCGIDRVPNGAHAAAVRTSKDAERRVSHTESDLSRAEDAAARAQREMFSAEAAQSAAQRDVDAAKSDLDGCRASASQPKGDSRPPGERCRREERRLSKAESELGSARSAADAARSTSNAADSRAQSARRERDDARSELIRALAELARTPAILEVERSCSHQYRVAQHEVRAWVGLQLRAAPLEQPASDFPVVRYEVRRADETFPAEPGRCAEVAAGDPLTLPDEHTLRRELAARVAAGVAGSVHGSYDTYRQGFHDEWQRLRTAGDAVGAAESRVRWLLTGPGTPREITPG
jgi:tetratricopeptide (TPR) repeat protein